MFRDFALSSGVFFFKPLASRQSWVECFIFLCRCFFYYSRIFYANKTLGICWMSTKVILFTALDFHLSWIYSFLWCYVFVFVFYLTRLDFQVFCISSSTKYKLVIKCYVFLSKNLSSSVTVHSVFSFYTSNYLV